MKRIMSAAALLLLAGGCTSEEVTYCRSYGVEGTAEYGKCLDYYAQQEAVFGSDRAACAREADATYPPTLYDYGGYARTTIGSGWGGRHHGGFYGGHTIFIDPDYRHNREVDRLRMRIIEPCMQARGWVSGNSWQAGRQKVQSHPPKRTPGRPQQNGSQKLPWL
jgi:hypothetical protein